MAVTVVFDGTRIDDAEALSPAGGNVWLDSSGKAASLEPDFVYQNANSVSEKVGTSELGIGLDTSGGTPASFDMTTPKVFIAKVTATNSNVLNAKGSTGGILEIGSGGLRTNYDRYYVVGGDTYPIKGGWLIIPIDPNGGNQSARPGTAPTLSAIDYFGWVCTFSGTSKSQNVAMDAVDIVPNGSGLTMTGGTPDGKFSDFVSTDEGTSTNRWGIVSTQDTVIYVTGTLTIGSATATQFTDSNGVIIYPEAEFLNSVGFFGLKIDLQNASTAVDISNWVFKSVGTSGGTVDTRPDYTVTGTSGTLALDGLTINVFRNITLTSGATLTNSSLISGLLLTQAGGTITGNVFDSPTPATSVAFMDVDDISKVTDNSFISGGTGYAITGFPTATTYTLTDLSFSGYAATDGSTGNEAIYVEATTGTVTLNISGGTTPSVRTAGATVVKVINPVAQAVNVKDVNGTNLQNVRVFLETASTIASGEIFEAAVTSLSQSAGTATCTTTAAHGLATNDYVVIRGAQPDGYNKVAQVTVSSTTVFTYTVSSGLSSPATGTPVVSFVPLYGLTDASGNISASRTWDANQDLKGWARLKNTVSPFYKQGDIAYTVDKTNGNSTNVVLQPDE